MQDDGGPVDHREPHEGVLERGSDRSFVYRAGSLRVLPLPPGGTHTYALGINRAGVVVGYADDATGDRAVAWVGGRITDLNSLLPASVRRAGVELRVAYAVNDCGAVVGVGQAPDGHGHAYLLSSALPGSRRTRSRSGWPALRRSAAADGCGLVDSWSWTRIWRARWSERPNIAG